MAKYELVHTHLMIEDERCSSPSIEIRWQDNTGKVEIVPKNQIQIYEKESKQNHTIHNESIQKGTSSTT